MPAPPSSTAFAAYPPSLRSVAVFHGPLPSPPAGTSSFHLSESSEQLLDRKGEHSITLTGLVATAPRRITTSAGLDIASFRLATTQRRYDQNTHTWVDGSTNWYTVTAFRHLAANTYTSIQKGDRVIVTGTVRIRDWESGEKTGTSIDVDADAIGHDLNWGTSTLTRTPKTAPAAEPESTSPATVSRVK